MYLPRKMETYKDYDIIVTIVTRLELLKLKAEIIKLDPSAFLYVSTIKETSGGILKKNKN